MDSVSDIFIVILKSLFTGFGFVIPVFALIKTSNLKFIAFKELFILTAVQAVRIAGIVYFILSYLHIHEDMQAIKIIGDTNAYLFRQLLPPLACLVLSQLLWIKKLYIKKAVLITFGLMFLILPFLVSQKFRMLVTSLQMDHQSNVWTEYFGSVLIEFALNVIVFIFIVITIILAGGKLKKIIDK